MQRSVLARQNGLDSARYEDLRDIEGGNLSPREKAALRFGEAFTNDPAGMSAGLYEDLHHHFSPPEVVEIAVLCAWQANVNRVVHTSWGRHNPSVQLPYRPWETGFPAGAGSDRSPSAPSAGDGWDPDIPREPDVRRISEEWKARGTPPPDFLDYLAVAPHVLTGWSEFHRLTFGEGVLPRRLKALVLFALAQVIGHEAWVAGLVPGKGKGGAGITPGDLELLKAGHFDAFSAREAAALRYTERLETAYRVIEDDFIAEVARPFTHGEFLELGLFVGMHMGGLRLAKFLARVTPR